MKRSTIAVLSSYFSYILFLGLGFGLYARGLWLLSPLLFIYGVIPLLDAVTSRDKHNFKLDDFSKFQIRILRFSPKGFTLIYICNVILYGFQANSFSPLELVAAILSMGAVGSVAITASHELIHKGNKKSRFIGNLGMLFVSHRHFEYSHNYGHHRDAATLKDNHTAWKNEGFYTYLARTTVGAFKFCWNFETLRLQRKGVAIVSLQNKFLMFIFSTILLCTAFAFVSFSSFLFFLGQSYIAVTALEAVAYLEHYGLLRKTSKTATSNEVEAMSDLHSWNSYHRFSNYLTFMLPRHADHHTQMSKDFFVLESNDVSPQLPYGYPLMILIAFCPPLWMAIMNPRLESHSPASSL